MKPLTGLCGSYLALWRAKQMAKEQGVDPMMIEYTPLVVQAKKVFREWFFKCCDLEIDATQICTTLIARALDTSPV
jgi:hypothetical protein